MTGVVLALDQGTSSTRCIAFDEQLRELASASVPVPCSFPAPGWVEQDAGSLVASARTAIAEAMARGSIGWAGVEALSIANQTETFVVWERDGGRPVHDAIVWQCRRTAAACAALAAEPRASFVRDRTGLELDATFPASKLRWLLDHVAGADAAAEAGELAYGDVASWLVWGLTGGRTHVTDAGNAGRSLLCALGSDDWDRDLLDLFGVPASLLPPIADSDATLAVTDGDLIGGEVPIVGVLGDQQASLLGQRCLAPGQTKVTLGTGAFAWMQAGGVAPAPPPGVLACCAWRRGGQTSFALEGFVPAAGSLVDWLCELGVLPAPDQVDAIVREADRRAGAAAFVPALQGLGTPTWRADARGALVGLTRATSRADVVAAALDGIAHQLADALDAMASSTPVETVRADGGLARSAWLLQRLADLTGARVERATRQESTAFGAATLGALARGLLAEEDLGAGFLSDVIAEPQLPDGRRREQRAEWRALRDAASAW